MVYFSMCNELHWECWECLCYVYFALKTIPRSLTNESFKPQDPTTILHLRRPPLANHCHDDDGSVETVILSIHCKAFKAFSHHFLQEDIFNDTDHATRDSLEYFVPKNWQIKQLLNLRKYTRPDWTNRSSLVKLVTYKDAILAIPVSFCLFSSFSHHTVQI